MTNSRLISKKINKFFNNTKSFPIIEANYFKHGLFSKILEANNLKHPLVQLINDVDDADYDKVEETIDKNPRLMFEPLTMKHRNNEVEIITSIGHAFNKKDTRMWGMVLDKIKNDRELLEQFKLLAWEEVEKDNHFDLQPLFDAYEQAYCHLAKVTDSNLCTLIVDIARKQRELLPAHLIREFCDEQKPWRKDTSFDTKHSPRPKHANIENYRKDKIESLFPYKPNIGLGYDFVLVRGALGPCAGVDIAPRLSNFYNWFAHDAQMLENLYEIRRREFDSLLWSLRYSSEFSTLKFRA